MSFETQLVQMSRYELTASADAYTEAITALSGRTEAEGPEGVLRYSFYVDPEGETAGSLIIYRDPEAWMAQHDVVGPWEEYQRFYQTIRLVGLRFLGNFPAEIRGWLDERGLSYEYLGHLAAGFERS